MPSNRTVWHTPIWLGWSIELSSIELPSRALTWLSELSLPLIIIMEPWPGVSLVMAFSFITWPLIQIGLNPAHPLLLPQMAWWKWVGKCSKPVLTAAWHWAWSSLWPWEALFHAQFRKVTTGDLIWLCAKIRGNGQAWTARWLGALFVQWQARSLQLCDVANDTWWLLLAFLLLPLVK